MGYRVVAAANLSAERGPHPAASPYDKGIGAALGVERFGIYEVELPPGAETVAHDHAEDGAEDVYAVIGGSGVVLVDGAEVPIRPGTFIAVDQASTRQVRAGDDGITFIAVCR